MRCFWGKGIGILLVVFGIGLVLSILMPLKAIVFILTLLIIYIGLIIFRIC